MSKPSIDQLTSPALVSDLQSVPLDEVRRRREQCQEAEEFVSLQRRLVQGRLDIVQAELGRRQGENPPSEDLIKALPDILSDRGERNGISGRLLSIDPSAEHFGPEFDRLVEKLDKIVDGARLSQLSDESDASLHSIADELAELERGLSTQRHALHEHIDVIQAEIIRRYKSGEASVDGLLDT